MWGDNDLGDNFSLLEGDKVQDRVIVYCSGRSSGACFGGTPIVPTYYGQFDENGHYAEYVENAKSNNKFIIAQTLKLKYKEKNYWIISKDMKIENCEKINCDSIIQSHVLGPMDSSEFQTKISELHIDLKFDRN